MRSLALALSLAACSPVMQAAGVPAPVADTVEAVGCAATRAGRFRSFEQVDRDFIDGRDLPADVVVVPGDTMDSILRVVEVMCAAQGRYGLFAPIADPADCSVFGDKISDLSADDALVVEYREVCPS